MVLHEDFDDQSYNDYKYEDGTDELSRKKNIKRRLEERLERKRLKEEFHDDFDELAGEFDWDQIDK